jgi:hypothetical protein
VQKRAESYINIRKKELLNFRGQAVETANRYTALEANSHLLRNEDGMVTIYGKTICILNKDQEEKLNILRRIIQLLVHHKKTRFRKQDRT